MTMLTVIALAAMAMQTEPMGRDEVVAAINARPTQTAAIDPFSAAPPSDLAGRDVAFTTPILMADAPDGSPLFQWIYDLGKQRLSIRILPMDYNGSTAFIENDDFVVPVLTPVSGWAVKQTSTRGGRREMSNAYGARVMAEVVETKTWAVAEIAVSSRRGAELPGRQYPFYTHVMEIEPDEARLLTSSLRFEARGSVRDFTPGRNVVCGSNFVSATVSNPRQTSGETCVLSVEWSSFAIIDGRTNTPVKVWAED
ncbi:hypothetical protein [Brevundimonas sp. BAL3]|uniref:hypothetical protein n=1 Tax=Brevundimonas sp. BAL3 TaxID=391600 RepID=UPI0012EA3426|nr:hypothetical protein [Brevundimonas sp. BAL3]